MISKQTRYLADDSLPLLKRLAEKHNKVITFIDLETNGLMSVEKTNNRGFTYEIPNDSFAITEVGILHITPKGKIIESGLLVYPDEFMPAKAMEVTGITPDMVLYQRPWRFHVNKIHEWMNNHIMVGFNSINFDFKALTKVNLKEGVLSEVKYPRDVRSMYVRATNKEFGTKGKLTELAERYNVSLDGDAHRAGYDIALTALLAEKFLELHGLDLFDHPDSSRRPDEIVALDINGSAIKKAPKYQNEIIHYFTTTPCGDIKVLAGILGVEDRALTSSLISVLESGVLKPQEVLPQEQVSWLKERTAMARSLAWKGASSGPYSKVMKILKEYNPPFDLTYTHIHVAIADNPIIEEDYLDYPDFNVIDMVRWS